MSLLRPVVHILAVVREQLTEALYEEGHDEFCTANMDKLAVQLWRTETMDTIFREIKEVLPSDKYLRVLAFTAREYGLLYTSLPADVKDASTAEYGAVLREGC